jgi:hypothetical protein
MTEFLVTITFPQQLSREFLSLIPAHRIRVNELMQNGVITSYSLAADRSMLWITLLAESTESADLALANLPLYPYMKYTIHELMFHNTPMFATPRFSVN